MGIRLISREETFEQYQALANYVISWQQLEYADFKMHLEPADLRHFEKCLDDNIYSNPEIQYSGEHIFVINDGKLDSLISAIKNLLGKLNINELTFIPVYKEPWLKQKNNYDPVKNAIAYIKTIVVSKGYNGGIAVSNNDIEEMLTSVFWITRCNASVCGLYFASPKSNIVFGLCQYGGLHFYFYDKKVKEDFGTLLPDTGLIEVDNCTDVFGKFDIAGRQLKV